MDFLFKYTKWSNAELGIIKAAVTFSGISIGVYFYEYLKPYFPYFVGLFLIFGIWSGVLWIKKMQVNNK